MAAAAASAAAAAARRWLLVAAAVALVAAVAAAAAAAQDGDGGDDVQMHMTEIDSELRQYWYAGAEDESDVVYVLTRRHSLYRSADDGVSWTRVGADRLPGLSDKGVAFIIATADPQLQYVFPREAAAGYWLTRDGGETFSGLHFGAGAGAGEPRDIVWVTPHERHGNVALAIERVRDTAGAGGNFYATHVTFDGGRSWTLVANRSVDAVFGVAGGVQRADAVLTLLQPNSGDYRGCGGACTLVANRLTGGDGAARPPTGVEAHKVQAVLHGIESMLPITWSGTIGSDAPRSAAEHRVLFVEHARAASAGGPELLYSTDGGVKYRTAKFPFEPREFSVVSAASSGAGGGGGGNDAGAGAAGAEDSAFIVGASDERHISLPYSALLVNDLNRDNEFVQVLDKVHLAGPHRASVPYALGAGFALDVELAQGIDGIVIANRYASRFDGGGGGGGVDDGYGGCLQTVLSYDFGARWHTLQAPDGDESCGADVDAGDCHLHLYGPADGLARFYSAPGAPGIWFGQGNTGPCLLPRDAGDQHTYMSADAGKTWKRVGDGPHTYEIANHGALLLVAPTAAASNALRYSLDEGASWRTLSYATDSHHRVVNAVARTFSAKRFLVYGALEPQSGDDGAAAAAGDGDELPRGFLLNVALADAHGGAECSGIDAPGTPASDYELWSPSDVFGGRESGSCILGRRLSYVRRKASSRCHNPQAYEVLANERACPCARTDYECDFCYASVPGADGDDERSACQRTDTSACRAFFRVNDDCLLGTRNVSTTGMRLVPNTRCTFGGGALDYRPKAETCKPGAQRPDNGTPGGGDAPPSGGVWVVIAVSLLAIVGALAFCVYVKHTGRPAAVHARLFANGGALGTLGGGGGGAGALPDRLRRAPRTNRRGVDDAAGGADGAGAGALLADDELDAQERDAM